jgi:hypothetical protein
MKTANHVKLRTYVFTDHMHSLCTYLFYMFLHIHAILFHMSCQTQICLPMGTHASCNTPAEREGLRDAGLRT